MLVRRLKLSSDGAIDCFHVHPARQGEGVGLALTSRIEREARGRGNARLLADGSITAEPYFRRMGCSVVRRQIKIFHNGAFKQAVMENRTRHVPWTRSIHKRLKRDWRRGGMHPS